MSKIIATILINAITLILAAQFIPGFYIDITLSKVLVLTLIFTGLNMTLKPILKLLFAPFIVITLGLGLILINALILFILDLLTEVLSIENAGALILATLFIAIANFTLHALIRILR